MNGRLALLATAAACTLGVLAIAAPASANRNTPDADCAGLTFVMRSTEDGTTITITRNGAEVFSERNEVFGRGYDLSFPSPDRTVEQSWRVVVAGYNGTSVWAETVPACVAPTTVATSTSTTTSTTVAVAIAPVPSTPSSGSAPSVPAQVVVPPRTPAPTGLLPATGNSWAAASIAVTALGFGVAAVIAGRRRSTS